MKVIAAYSHKGGTGKSTALMMLANAISADGKTALLIDSDPQQNFAMYKTYSSEIDAWDENLEVAYYDFEGTKIANFEQALMDADESGKFDYALLNLSGADHPFNRQALRYAELTILPFKPAATELTELAPALNVIQELGKTGEIGQARVVFTMMKPEGKMTVAARDYKDAAKSQHPCMDTEIKDTAIFSDLVMKGLLNKVIEANADAKGLDKMALNRMGDALADCKALLSECDRVIGSSTGAEDVA
ncbi:ParA family protein [Cereibacter sp. SYSU M97828]|nr:ParA family protein [Cereibacter flavus]